MAKIEFLGADGETLAHTTFADDLIRDTGKVGDVTEFDISAQVVRKGRVSHYRITAPFNCWAGEVVQGPQGVFEDNKFTLDNLEVGPGKKIDAVIRGISDGTGDQPDESKVETLDGVTFEDGSGVSLEG